MSQSNYNAATGWIVGAASGIIQANNPQAPSGTVIQYAATLTNLILGLVVSNCVVYNSNGTTGVIGFAVPAGPPVTVVQF